MSDPIATLTILTELLENGTGDPGLQFQVPDAAKLVQMHEGDTYEYWAVAPVGVYNTDGYHEDCVLIITINLDDGGKPTYHFLAVDPEGEPCAYHSC